MRFISDGDFIFPFESYYYSVKHLFIWSYQNGTANPDGIIRLPGRLIYLLAFSWFGNIAVSYFFLVSSLLIVFGAFYYFIRVFLHNATVGIALLCSLFFTLNPIFLGNLAKIGLVLAAAMLPPSLAVINRAFERKRLRYLLLWVVFMNISLIHPFTFTVNFLVSGAYFLYQSRVHRTFAKHHIVHFIAVGFTALLLNAYFILPLASMGTVSKDALSSDVTATPVNYTSLVDIANTGDIFTGLSLSKNVLKDFEFYNPLYQNFYFLGAFAIYVILLGIYLRVESRINLVEKKRFGVFLVAFLALILLATVKLWHVDSIIKFAIGMPGGWMFRSPLKWQLYVPLVLFGMLAIVLMHIQKRGHRQAIYLGLGISFLLMNGFIATNIYHDLLQPRQVQYFQALANTPIDHQNLLIVGSDQCFSFADANPHVMTELNQVLISKPVQVKQVGIGDIDTVNLGSYSYILGCQKTLDTVQISGYKLQLRQQFADGAFQLYQNTMAQPYIYSAADVISLDKPRSLNDTAGFTESVLHKPFVTTSATTTANSDVKSPVLPNTTGVQDLFDKLNFGALKQGSISTDITPIHSGKQTVYIKQTTPLYYRQAGGELTFSATALTGFLPLKKTNNTQQLQQLSLDLKAGETLRVSYKDPAYSYINLIANSSLEKGSWQKDVGDCYAYDKQPDIAMKIISNDATDGKNSLQLQARNHIACTGPNEIAVKEGQHYLLSFDYKNIGGKFGGYYINFNDPNQTVMNGRLKGANETWDTFTKNIKIPEGANRIRVIVYSYPDGTGVTYGTVHYDHFQLTGVPDVQGHFNLVSSPAQVLSKPKETKFTVNNPTKNTIHVIGASTRFFLGTQESYNAGWKLSAGTSTLGSKAAQHFKLNGSMNGWLIDPAAICSASGSSSSGCTRRADGSYDLALAMEFAPQKLVHVGILISGVTAGIALTYFVFDSYKDRISRRFWLAAKRRKP